MNAEYEQLILNPGGSVSCRDCGRRWETSAVLESEICPSDDCPSWDDYWRAYKVLSDFDIAFDDSSAGYFELHLEVQEIAADYDEDKDYFLLMECRAVPHGIDLKITEVHRSHDYESANFPPELKEKVDDVVGNWIDQWVPMLERQKLQFTLKWWDSSSDLKVITDTARLVTSQQHESKNQNR